MSKVHYEESDLYQALNELIAVLAEEGNPEQQAVIIDYIIRGWPALALALKRVIWVYNRLVTQDGNSNITKYYGRSNDSTNQSSGRPN